MVFGFVTSFLFFAFGVWLLIKFIFLRIKCKYQVEAIVDGYKEETSDDGIFCYAIFSYSFDGKSYVKNSKLPASKSKFQEGSYVKLYIDPESPDNFYCPKETVSELILWLIWIGISCIGVYALGINL